MQKERKVFCRIMGHHGQCGQVKGIWQPTSRHHCSALLPPSPHVAQGETVESTAGSAGRYQLVKSLDKLYTALGRLSTTSPWGCAHLTTSPLSFFFTRRDDQHEQHQLDIVFSSPQSTLLRHLHSLGIGDRVSQRMNTNEQRDKLMHRD